MTTKQAYEQGFIQKCAERGVDPVKLAQDFASKPADPAGYAMYMKAKKVTPPGEKNMRSLYQTATRPAPAPSKPAVKPAGKPTREIKVGQMAPGGMGVSQSTAKLGQEGPATLAPPTAKTPGPSAQFPAFRSPAPPQAQPSFRMGLGQPTNAAPAPVNTAHGRSTGFKPSLFQRPAPVPGPKPVPGNVAQGNAGGTSAFNGGSNGLR